MKIPSLVAVSAAALLTLSACGSGSSGSTTGAAAQPAAGSAGNAAGQGLSVASTSLGKVLVDSRGMTLYTLSADGQNKSTCASDCLKFWPAVAPTKARALSVTIGRTATPDGTAIATVAGHPVYTFSLDQQPGDVKGEGINEFGGTWYAVSATGQPVTGAQKSPAGGSSSGTSTRGYAY
jgi:predicted lipoprotein with Yx(FWY)xxD motif